MRFPRATPMPLDGAAPHAGRTYLMNVPFGPITDSST
jgi:hypothetical protein